MRVSSCGSHAKIIVFLLLFFRAAVALVSAFFVDSSRANNNKVRVPSVFGRLLSEWIHFTASGVSAFVMPATTRSGESV